MLRRTRSIYLVLLLAPGCTTSELLVPNVHTVKEGVLIRGAQPDREGYGELARMDHVRTVVNLNDATVDSDREMAEGAGMRYFPIPCDPFCPDTGKYKQFLCVVEDSDNWPVYVHCQDGMDRTGMAVASYRIVVEGWSAERALAELRSHQTLPHVLLFQDVAPFVMSVEKDRANWPRGPARLDAAARRFRQRR